MKVALWQAVFYTIFVLALPTYLPNLSWEAYMAVYLVMFGLWSAALWELRKRWRAFMQRHFPEKGTPKPGR